MARLLRMKTNVVVRAAADYPGAAPNSVTLEVLHGAFVLLGCAARLEGAEVAALAGLGIGLARIEPVFTGCELADHEAASSCAAIPLPASPFGGGDPLVPSPAGGG